MRTVTDGKGNDSTSAVQAWLAAGNELFLKNLYLIGEPEDPNALWLTDHDAPLLWSYWGTFVPAVISRGSVSSKVGFEVQTLQVKWSPNNQNFTQNLSTTSPYQQTWMGKFSNVSFRAWTVYMPTLGDANTFGASELFGGTIGDVTTQRGQIQFTVNSGLAFLDQPVPGSVIETLNSIAGFAGATPPSGLTKVPTFQVFNASTSFIAADCLTPTAGQLFSTNAFQGGFVFFTSGSLAGLFSTIEANTAAGGHNQFTLFQAFPWAPVEGDQFYASATFPINQADGEYFGFPFVPDPSNAFA